MLSCGGVEPTSYIFPWDILDFATAFTLVIFGKKVLDLFFFVLAGPAEILAEVFLFFIHDKQ